MANEAGAGASDRGSYVGDYTFVSKGFPASISGNVIRIRVYHNGLAGAGTAYAAFFTASGNNLTTVAGTRTALTYGAAVKGVKEWTAPTDFTAFPVSAGQYLGLWLSLTDQITYVTSGGSGMWYVSNDHTNAAAYTFTVDDDGIDGLSADIDAAAGGSIVPQAMAYYMRMNG